MLRNVITLGRLRDFCVSWFFFFGEHLGNAFKEFFIGLRDDFVAAIPSGLFDVLTLPVTLASLLIQILRRFDDFVRYLADSVGLGFLSAVNSFITIPDGLQTSVMTRSEVFREFKQFMLVDVYRALSMQTPLWADSFATLMGRIHYRIERGFRFLRFPTITTIIDKFIVRNLARVITTAINLLLSGFRVCAMIGIGIAVVEAYSRITEGRLFTPLSQDAPRVPSSARHRHRVNLRKGPEGF